MFIRYLLSIIVIFVVISMLFVTLTTKDMDNCVVQGNSQFNIARNNAQGDTQLLCEQDKKIYQQVLYCMESVKKDRGNLLTSVAYNVSITLHPDIKTNLKNFHNKYCSQYPELIINQDLIP